MFVVYWLLLFVLFVVFVVLVVFLVSCLMCIAVVASCSLFVLPCLCLVSRRFSLFVV